MTADPHDTLHFTNANEGFVYLLSNFVSKSYEIIPGTNLSFEELFAVVKKSADQLQGKILHRARVGAKEEGGEAPEEQAEGAQAPSPAKDVAGKFGGNWADDEDVDEEPTKEEEPEHDDYPKPSHN